MFGGSSGQASQENANVEHPQAEEANISPSSTDGGEKSAGNPSESPNSKLSPDDTPAGNEKKRRSSGVSKAKDMFTKAKQSLDIGQTQNSGEKSSLNPLSKLSKADPALNVPQGSLNNSAGESVPGPRSTFRVGVTEDKNKKCRRTMEDTHAYLYNFLSTPAPNLASDSGSKLSVGDSGSTASEPSSQQVVETDNGYFAIFDGHAGTFAADWCGKKLHVLLEETIRKNPNTAVPELLDQTFTQVDQQLEKLPLKNSGCTAVTAVLRWEDRVPSTQSATGSAFFAPAAAAAVKAASEGHSLKTSQTSPEDDSVTPTQSSAVEKPSSETPPADSKPAEVKPDVAAAQESKLRETASRQRVLYTANVGDARIVLCRNGRALRLSYDHKGSDENEGRRIANAGGLILNNRVNGVLAVTRALGDTYMKDLVTGHPYTTETVIQPDQDEFLILACDGLWDVCSDQEAVDLVRNTQDPQSASKQLVDHALARFSTDNLSCMIVRFDNKALKQRRNESSIGVDGDEKPSASILSRGSGVSETDAIVEQARKSLSEGGGVPVGPAESADDSPELERVDEGIEAQEPSPELDPTALQERQKAVVEERKKRGESVENADG